MTAMKPAVRPVTPHFSSGPCAKIPGWSPKLLETAFTGRSQVDRAFASAGFTPNVALTALDSDVIKTYVRLNVGVGILAEMAYEPKVDADLKRIDASHLFAPSVTRVGLRRNAFLRRFAYDFIVMFAPSLKRSEIEEAVFAA